MARPHTLQVVCSAKKANRFWRSRRLTWSSNLREQERTSRLGTVSEITGTLIRICPPFQEHHR